MFRLSSHIRWPCRGEPSMPRKSPDAVQEVRLTMGNFERAQLAQVLQAQTRMANINAVKDGAKAVLNVSAASVMLWLGYQTYLIANPPDDQFKNPTGANLWSNIKMRTGIMSNEAFERAVQENERKAKENESRTQKGTFGRALDYFLFGSDEKFFFFET